MSSISALLGTAASSHLNKQLPSRFSTIHKQVHSFVFLLKEKVQVLWRKFWDLICRICFCKKEELKIKQPTYLPPPKPQKKPSNVSRTQISVPISQPKPKRSGSSGHAISQEIHELTRRPSPLSQLGLEPPRSTSVSEIPPRGFRLFIRTPDSVKRHMLCFLPARDVIRFGRTCKLHNTAADDGFVWRSLRERTFPGIPISPEDEDSHKVRYKLMARRINCCTVPGHVPVHITYYVGITTLLDYRKKIAAQRGKPLAEIWIGTRSDRISDRLLCSEYFRDHLHPDGTAHVPHPEVHPVSEM